MRPRDNPVLRLASPLKAALQKLTMALLVAAAFALMILGKADAVLVERARAVLSDVLAPVLEFFAEPVAFVNGAIDQAQALVDVRAENLRLKEEQARLMQWRAVAERLEAENKALRKLLKVAPDPSLDYVAARVIGDSGGAFVRSVIVTAGAADGVAKGQAALASEGLAGRVHEVGQRAARVLLITDINSRIPVLVERTRDIAMLAGDNSDTPRLLYLLPGAAPRPGDRIITSGHGGVLPPGLAVGVVARAEDGIVTVQPLAALHRLDYLSLVNYGLPGLLDSPAAASAGSAR